MSLGHGYLHFVSCKGCVAFEETVSLGVCPLEDNFVKIGTVLVSFLNLHLHVLGHSFIRAPHLYFEIRSEVEFIDGLVSRFLIGWPCAQGHLFLPLPQKCVDGFVSSLSVPKEGEVPDHCDDDSRKVVAELVEYPCQDGSI